MKPAAVRPRRVPRRPPASFSKGTRSRANTAPRTRCRPGERYPRNSCGLQAGGLPDKTALDEIPHRLAQRLFDARDFVADLLLRLGAGEEIRGLAIRTDSRVTNGALPVRCANASNAHAARRLTDSGQ